MSMPYIFTGNKHYPALSQNILRNKIYLRRKKPPLIIESNPDSIFSKTNDLGKWPILGTHRQTQIETSKRGCGAHHALMEASKAGKPLSMHHTNITTPHRRIRFTDATLHTASVWFFSSSATIEFYPKVRNPMALPWRTASIYTKLAAMSSSTLVRTNTARSGTAVASHVPPTLLCNLCQKPLATTCFLCACDCIFCEGKVWPIWREYTCTISTIGYWIDTA